MSQPLFFLSIDIATIVCAALIAARVLASYPKLRSAQLIALMALGNICNVVLGRYDYRYWIPMPFQISVGGLASLFDIGRNLAPGLLMLVCHTLFVDKRRFPPWLLALFLLQLLLDQPGRALLPDNHLVTDTAPALLQTLFAGMALYWTLANWRGDLVETRRRTRVVTLAVVGISTIISGLLPQLIDPNSIAHYFTHVALIASHLAIMLFLLFELSGDSLVGYLDPARPAPRSQPPDPQSAAALARLAALLDGEHIYRQPGLSLDTLATRAGVPGYRLRKIIHEQLGYTNFNAFLHAYRIREACVALRDPKQQRIPILTIALTVGYQSVNTFNRGFRDVMAMTPSGYRALADAPPPPAPRILAPENQ